MKPEQARSLDLAFAHPRRDTRPIYEWARANIAELPPAYALRGRFNVDNSPWLKEPFHSLADKSVRRTTVLKAIQSGGTLLSEIWLVWAVLNNAGPMAYTCQSQDMVDLESKTRLFPLMEACPPVARLLPRPGPYRTVQEVFFPHGAYIVLNSATPSAQQSQSIKLRVNDEIWMPRWADVYPDACARVTAFEQQGTSHILDVSQGGFDSGDGTCWATWSFKNGSMEEWSIVCPECKKAQPLRFKCERADGTRAGVVWDKKAKRDDGTFNERIIGETAHWECVHCPASMPDGDATRVAWRKSGHYVRTNDAAPATWRSFHWEGMVAHPLSSLAVEWAQAENLFHRTGDESARIKFRQKRESAAWVSTRNTIEIFERKEKSGYETGTFRPAKVPGEVGRHMTIDRQKDHWWVEVGAWGTEPSLTYRQLWFGRCDSLGQIRSIQVDYGVENWAVAQDRGYMPSEVDRDCLNFGWSGLEGSKTRRKRWLQRDEASGGIVAFPTSDVMLSPINGTTVPYCVFSGDFFKDILAAALAGEGGIKWLTPDDANPLWFEHIKGEEKRETRPGVWDWVETKNNADNHGLDTSVMQLVIASVRGIIKTEPEKEE